MSLLKNLYPQLGRKTLHDYVSKVSIVEIGWCYGGASWDSPLTVAEQLVYKDMDRSFLDMTVSTLPKEMNHTYFMTFRSLHTLCPAMEKGYMEYLMERAGKELAMMLDTSDDLLAKVDQKLNHHHQENRLKKAIVTYMVASAKHLEHPMEMARQAVAKLLNEFVDRTVNVSAPRLPGSPSSIYLILAANAGLTADEVQSLFYHFMGKDRIFRFLYAEVDHLQIIMGRSVASWMDFSDFVHRVQPHIEGNMHFPMYMAAFRSGIKDGSTFLSKNIMELMKSFCMESCTDMFMYYYFGITQEQGQNFYSKMTVMDLLSKYGNVKRMQVFPLAYLIKYHMAHENVPISKDTMQKEFGKHVAHDGIGMTMQETKDFFGISDNDMLNLPMKTLSQQTIGLTGDDLLLLMDNAESTKRYLNFKFGDWFTMFPKAAGWQGYTGEEVRKMVAGGGELYFKHI